MSFKIPITLCALFVSSLAFAGALDSDCVGPAGAPVKAIYLHGWYSPSGGGNFGGLERGNRQKMTELAQKLGIRIAIPQAPNINGRNGYREWPSGSREILKSAETSAVKACGSPLAPKRSLIGFSNGGYAARNVALGCDAYTKANYSQIIMMGAKARPLPPVKKGQPARDNTGCPPLTAMHGDKDGLGDFPETAKKMAQSIPGNVVNIERYKGGHELAPLTRLASIIGGSGGNPAAPTPVPPNVATAPAPRPVAPPPTVAARPSRPAVITGGTSATFMSDDLDAIK